MGIMIIIPNLTWFYLHVLLASVILYKDYNGTLEESLNRFEQSIGLYTPPDTTEIEYIEPPFYVPPLEQDSTGRRDSFRTAELILWDSPNSVIQIKQDLNQSQDWFTPLAIQIWNSRLVAKQRELS